MNGPTKVVPVPCFVELLPVAVTGGGSGWQCWLVVGEQRFQVGDYHPTLNQAEFFAYALRVAIGTGALYQFQANAAQLQQAIEAARRNNPLMDPNHFAGYCQCLRDMGSFTVHVGASPQVGGSA